MAPSNLQELIVRTATGAGSILVQVTSETPFIVRQGEDAQGPGLHWETLLEPAGAHTEAPASWEKPGTPTVFVWYHAPERAQDAAVQPDAEQLETLRALGYLE